MNFKYLSKLIFRKRIFHHLAQVFNNRIILVTLSVYENWVCRNFFAF